MDASLAAVIVGFFAPAATFCVSVTVDIFGRRILLIASYLLQTICFIIMGTYFEVQRQNADAVNGWQLLPVVTLCVYVFMNVLGATSVTFIILGEIFAQNIKDAAAAICMSCDYTFVIVVGLLFPFLSETIGTAGAFFVFAGFNAAALLFVSFLVPETKGKSFEEIQRLLQGEKPVSPSKALD